MAPAPSNPTGSVVGLFGISEAKNRKIKGGPKIACRKRFLEVSDVKYVS